MICLFPSCSLKWTWYLFAQSVSKKAFAHSSFAFSVPLRSDSISSDLLCQQPWNRRRESNTSICNTNKKILIIKRARRIKPPSHRLSLYSLYPVKHFLPFPAKISCNRKFIPGKRVKCLTGPSFHKKSSGYNTRSSLDYLFDYLFSGRLTKAHFSREKQGMRESNSH